MIKKSTSRFKRADGRKFDELRPCKITRNFIKNATGSVLIECGDTRVICTATTENKVPPFLDPEKEGWLTSEYGMLPGSTSTRKSRDRNGRSSEIQRLIGRSLRAVVDRTVFPGTTIYIDCDVIQADGGTRTASITGAYVALVDACKALEKEGVLTGWPLKDSIAAVSIGVIEKTPLLDLDYSEDYRAEVDMNIVMTGGGQFVEVQGTGEGSTFTDRQLNQMLKLARQGIANLTAIQEKALKRR